MIKGSIQQEDITSVNRHVPNTRIPKYMKPMLINIKRQTGGQGGWITRSRDRDHPGQQGETLSLLKIQKLAGHGGVRLQSQLLGRLRQGNCLNPGGGGCGEPRSCHCTPAWQQSKRDSVSRKIYTYSNQEKMLLISYTLTT